jgi:hypothetical protein
VGDLAHIGETKCINSYNILINHPVAQINSYNILINNPAAQINHLIHLFG